MASYLASLAVNFGLLAILLTVQFEARYLRLEPNLATVALIAPVPARVAPRVPLKYTRLLSVPAPRSPLPRLTATPDLPPALRTEPVSSPPRIVAPPPPSQVVTGSFQASAVAAAPSRQPATLKPGGFAPAEAVSIRPGIPSRPAQVGSFGSTAAAPPSGPADRGMVAAADFGSSAGASRLGTQGRRAVGTAGFEATALAAAKPRLSTATTTGAFRSVEILNKPKPDYTEEARRKRVQGEVWLEVLFGADGTSRVQRVLRSLGSGLDESAIASARQIRFRPAREGSTEVDQVATVRVQFQLVE